MKAVGAVRDGLEWTKYREFFYWRLRRRLAEQRLVQDLCTADSRMIPKDAQELVCVWLKEALGSCSCDEQISEFLQHQGFTDRVKAVHGAAVERSFCAMGAELEKAGQLTGAKRLMFRCLFPQRPGASEASIDRNLRSTAGQGPFPALLGSSRSSSAKKTLR